MNSRRVPVFSKAKPKKQKSLAGTPAQPHASFDIPAWVPPCISDLAQTMSSQIDHAQRSEAFEILERLTTDHRMQKVWHELFRTRKAGGFFNSALSQHRSFQNQFLKAQRYKASTLRKLGGDENLKTAKRLERENQHDEFLTEYFQKFWLDLLPNADPSWQRSIQDIHARHLFRSAFTFARHDTARIKKDAAEFRPRLLEAAKLLQDTAGLHRAMRLPDSDSRALERISAAFARRSLELFPEDLNVGTNTRNRGNARSRAYVLRLGEICRQLFGSPMMTTVATITNVALDCNDVTAARVRGILRSHRLDMAGRK